jgi:hypothetical protein
MITKREVKTRLFHMVSIFMVSALICMCGYIVAPMLTIAEIDKNTMTVFKFLIMTAFIIHIFGMLTMGVLLVGDTMERIMSSKNED